ncbi:MAG: hypothetical protein WCA20_19940 [Candidatus Sulfotelmatobacter sp.]
MIANHEFEKARFYSQEERKERENLKQVREKYKLDDTPAFSLKRSSTRDRESRQQAGWQCQRLKFDRQVREV